MRNQFLRYDLLDGAVCEGRYGLPVIPAVNEIPKKIIPFNQAMTFPVEERKDVWVHFFIDDYQEQSTTLCTFAGTVCWDYTANIFILCKRSVVHATYQCVSKPTFGALFY